MYARLVEAEELHPPVDPVVLSRRDHGRRWTRATLDVTEDRARASDATPLVELAKDPEPPAPKKPAPVQSAAPAYEYVEEPAVVDSEMPARARGDLRQPEHPRLRHEGPPARPPPTAWVTGTTGQPSGRGH